MARSRDHSNQKNHIFYRIGFQALSLPFSESTRDSVANDGIERLWVNSGALFRWVIFYWIPGAISKGDCGCSKGDFGCSRCRFRNLYEILSRKMASRALGSILGPCFGGSQSGHLVAPSGDGVAPSGGGVAPSRGGVAPSGGSVAPSGHRHVMSCPPRHDMT